MFYTCLQAALASTVVFTIQTHLDFLFLVLRITRTTNRVVSLPKSLAGRSPENVLKFWRTRKLLSIHSPTTIHLLIYSFLFIPPVTCITINLERSKQAYLQTQTLGKELCTKERTQAVLRGQTFFKSGFNNYQRTLVNAP